MNFNRKKIKLKNKKGEYEDETDGMLQNKDYKCGVIAQAFYLIN